MNQPSWSKEPNDPLLREYLALPVDVDGIVVQTHRERAAMLRKALRYKYPSGDVLEHISRASYVVMPDA